MGQVTGMLETEQTTLQIAIRNRHVSRKLIGRDNGLFNNYSSFTFNWKFFVRNLENSSDTLLS